MYACSKISGEPGRPLRYRPALANASTIAVWGYRKPSLGSHACAYTRSS